MADKGCQLLGGQGREDKKGEKTDNLRSDRKQDDKNLAGPFFNKVATTTARQRTRRPYLTDRGAGGRVRDDRSTLCKWTDLCISGGPGFDEGAPSHTKQGRGMPWRRSLLMGKEMTQRV